MLWFILSLIGAVFDACYYAFIKKYVKGQNDYVLASGMFLGGGIILFLLTAFDGIPSIQPGFTQALIGTVLINIVATILYFNALHMTDLSLCTPMLSFSPIFLIFTSFFMLGELPTRYGMGGIALIVIGTYILNTTNNHTSMLDPLREIVKNKGVMYMLLVTFLFSFTSNFDKQV